MPNTPNQKVQNRDANAAIDWAAIRKDRDENGLSLRTLEIKYGVPKSTISYELSKVSKVSGQEKQPLVIPTFRTAPSMQSQKLTAVIAHTLIQKIAKRVLADLDPKEMKLLADTLSQCNKIIIAEEVEQEQAQEGMFIPLEKLSARTRMEIRRLIVEDEMQRKEQTG